MVMVVVGVKRLWLKCFENEHSHCTNLMCGSVIEIVVTKFDGVAVVYEVIGTRNKSHIYL